MGVSRALAAVDTGAARASGGTGGVTNIVYGA